MSSPGKVSTPGASEASEAIGGEDEATVVLDDERAGSPRAMTPALTADEVDAPHLVSLVEQFHGDWRARALPLDRDRRFDRVRVGASSSSARGSIRAMCCSSSSFRVRFVPTDRPRSLTPTDPLPTSTARRPTTFPCSRRCILP